MATKHWPSREALELGNRASATRHMQEKCALGYWTKGNNFETEILEFNTAYQVRYSMKRVFCTVGNNKNKNDKTRKCCSIVIAYI